MQKQLQIDGLDITLIITARAKSVAAEMLVSKDVGTDPILDDTVALIIETTGGNLLEPTGWPHPGELPETMTLGATASARFKFRNPEGKALKRAIVVLRGAFAEVPLGS